MTELNGPSCRRRHAFSLVELLVVVMLMGILAAAVAPAMSSIQLMRSGAARDDAVRLLELARARALATGMPTGLAVDLSDSSLSLVTLTDHGAVEGVIDPLTEQGHSVVIPAVYGGVTLASMTNGDGVSGSGVIWFNYEAVPQTRASDGALVASNSDDATIRLSSSESIVVHAYSGFVEAP